MPENINLDQSGHQGHRTEPRQNQSNRQNGARNYRGYYNKKGTAGAGESAGKPSQPPKSGNAERVPQANKGQNAKNGGQPSKPQQSNRQEQPRNAAAQNKSAHRPYNKPKNHRFDEKKINAIETVDDISADILRIEKEIELEIKEIAAMTLGV